MVRGSYSHIWSVTCHLGEWLWWLATSSMWLFISGHLHSLVATGLQENMTRTCQASWGWGPEACTETFPLPSGGQSLLLSQLRCKSKGKRLHVLMGRWAKPYRGLWDGPYLQTNKQGHFQGADSVYCHPVLNNIISKVMETFTIVHSKSFSNSYFLKHCNCLMYIN